MPIDASVDEAVLPARTVDALGGPDAVVNLIETTNGKPVANRGQSPEVQRTLGLRKSLHAFTGYAPDGTPLGLTPSEQIAYDATPAVPAQPDWKNIPPPVPQIDRTPEGLPIDYESRMRVAAARERMGAPRERQIQSPYAQPRFAATQGVGAWNPERRNDAAWAAAHNAMSRSFGDQSNSSFPQYESPAGDITQDGVRRQDYNTAGMDITKTRLPEGFGLIQRADGSTTMLDSNTIDPQARAASVARGQADANNNKRMLADLYMSSSDPMKRMQGAALQQQLVASQPRGLSVADQIKMEELGLKREELGLRRTEANDKVAEARAATVDKLIENTGFDPERQNLFRWFVNTNFRDKDGNGRGLDSYPPAEMRAQLPNAMQQFELWERENAGEMMNRRSLVAPAASRTRQQTLDDVDRHELFNMPQLFWTDNPNGRSVMGYHYNNLRSLWDPNANKVVEEVDASGAPGRRWFADTLGTKHNLDAQRVLAEREEVARN